MSVETVNKTLEAVLPLQKNEQPVKPKEKSSQWNGHKVATVVLLSAMSIAAAAAAVVAAVVFAAYVIAALCAAAAVASAATAFVSSRIKVISKASDVDREKEDDAKALKRYLELLEKFPKLKREGDLNDFKKGTYQILYKPEEIEQLRKEVYKRLFDGFKDKGMSEAEAHATAINWSRPGVVCEDQYWVWIRDCVISPHHYKHTYNRIIWKSDLDQTGGAGAAALPILEKDGKKHLILDLVFRHATSSWEFEMARGASKPGENPEATAGREMKEETGYEARTLVRLGEVTPDSGMAASVVLVYAGEAQGEKESQQDKTEAIKDRYTFTIEEVKDAFKQGFKEVDLNGKMTKIPLRDPFLSYALLMAELKEII